MSWVSGEALSIVFLLFPQSPSDGRTSRASTTSADRGASGTPKAPATNADIVREINGRIVLYKGKRLMAWSISDLVKQVG